MNIVKEHLDAKFGKRFSNYNEAKNAMFSDSERKNIIKSVNIAQPKYSNLRSSGFRKQKEHIKKLKLLRLRENEIKAGNVNNSKYGFIKAGNVYLKDLKSIKALNKHWYPLVSEFNKNTATTHINNYIYKAFGKTGINNKVVSAKNNYYNRLNDWDKLDFMQFLINYEYYKKYNSPPYAYSEKMSRLFKKFNKLEIATPSLVEDYAIKNRDGGVSVFDDNYWKVIYKKDYKVDYGNDFSGFGFANNYFDIRYIRSKNSKKKHKKLRKEALEKLLAVESTAEFAIANFIGELGISNQSQKDWLYKYKAKTNELIKFANDNRVDEVINSKVKSYVKGQIDLEVLTKDIPWVPSNGTVANLRYTHKHFDGSRGYYKLEDGSIVVNSSSEQTLTASGDLRDKYNEFNPNDKFYYIKVDGTDRWAEMLFNPNSLSDDLDNLFIMAGKDLGKNIGRYVLPIEDVKILIDGENFDGQQVARWKAAGGVLLTVAPVLKFGKVFVVVDRISDSNAVFGAIYKAGDKTISFGFKKLGEAAVILNNARRISGKAIGIGVEISGKWLKGTHGNAGFFPKSIADKMRNTIYLNFDEFRKGFWKNVADDTDLANQFSSSNRSRMRNGLAPKVHSSQQLGGQTSYVLHHKTPINRGGGVYDVDNLFIVTPRYHKEILLPEYHYGYGY